MTSITINYDLNEDRILVALHAGSPDACGYWLTRRMVLLLIQRANPFLDNLSPATAKTPMALRADLAEMEKEVALAVTEQAMSQTPATSLSDVRSESELAHEVTLANQGETIAVVFRGIRGGQSVLNCSRPELQRVIYMIEQEAVKAEWREASFSQSAAASQSKKRLAN